MEQETTNNSSQVPPEYFAYEDLQSIELRENIQMILLDLMKRIENFARAQFNKMQKRGVTVEYIVHLEPVGIGVKFDLAVKPYKSEHEEKLVLLVLEEGTKRIENFARGVMNLFRYRGILIEHYMKHSYNGMMILDEIGVIPLGIRIDVFKKLQKRPIRLHPIDGIEETISNDNLQLDRRKAPENYKGDDYKLHKKMHEILDHLVKGETFGGTSVKPYQKEPKD